MRVYDALGGPDGDFSKLSPPTSSQAGPVPGALIVQHGWRFISSDESWTASNPRTVSLLSPSDIRPGRETANSGIVLSDS